MQKENTFEIAISHLQYFCMFIGYARSGHSLVGSLLDAHPNIIISHELHALKCLAMGFSKEKIFEAILKKSQLFNKYNRMWSNYSYMVSPKWHGTFRKLKVIGDKQGGRTNKLLEENIKLLDHLRKEINLSHRYIHITRNPFDILTTMHRRSKHDLQTILIPKFFIRCENIKKLKQIIDPKEWLDLCYEDLLLNPRENITKLINFLGQETEEEHLNICQKFLFSKPIQRRFEFPWSQDLIYLVETKISNYSFLQQYQYSCQ